MKNLISKPLTEMQKEFARLHVENSFGKGMLSNTECAIKAGYAPESSYQRSYELLNPLICPHVVKYIGEMKEDFRKKNNIDPDKHMARLNYLGQLAEANKMVGVSLRAEELRGKVAGYYIDRQIIKSKKGIEDMSEEELDKKLVGIVNNNKHLINNKEKK
jgi:phage terminase small subunit|tara:strand:- start:191 stop:670 length:480 start_codon:yes stop_codon:yes gene_type:complete